MYKNRLEGKWTELQDKIKKHWGKITDDELKKIDGKYDELRGSLQWFYGYTKEEAEQRINKIFNS